MNIVWDDAALGLLSTRVETACAARIAKSAQKIAGTRFTVTAEGTQVVSRDKAAVVTEYGDGQTPADPWAHRAIREAGFGVGGGSSP